MTTKETLESSTAQSRKNNGTAPVVLITGALTGIGRATALAFAHDGARIVVSGRHDDEGQELVAELGKLGAEVEFLRSDVRHEDDVRSLVDQTVARFGRLDVAVNNAGTEGNPGPVTEQSAESYAAVFDTNVLGTLLSIKHELRVMLAPRSRQYHQCVVHLRSDGCSGCLSLRRQQACRRRTDKGSSARGSGVGCTCKCDRPRSD